MELVHSLLPLHYLLDVPGNILMHPTWGKAPIDVKKYGFFDRDSGVKNGAVGIHPAD